MAAKLSQNVNRTLKDVVWAIFGTRRSTDANNVCRDTPDLIVQLDVRILSTELDVKETVTVAMIHVMSQQDVEQSHQQLKIHDPIRPTQLSAM